MRWPLSCLEEPEWVLGRRRESADLDSWGDASLDTETLRGRRAACNGESRAGEMEGKLRRAGSSGWEWESREVDGGQQLQQQQGSAGRKDPPHPGLPAAEPELEWMVDFGVALLLGSGTESHGLRGRGSQEASRKTRRRVKLKRDGSLELSPLPLFFSICPRTSRQD